MKLNIDSMLGKFLVSAAVMALLSMRVLPHPTPVTLMVLLGAMAVAMGYLTTYIARRLKRH